MRMKPKSLVVVCVIGLPLLLATFALAQTGAILQEIGQCADPSGSDYCQLGIPPAKNPCNFRDGPDCADWFKFFSNGMDCTNIPGKSVVWADNLKSNGGPWSGCKSGTIPGSTCSEAYAACGTVEAYTGAGCGALTDCGAYEVDACIGTSAVYCEGNPL